MAMRRRDEEVVFPHAAGIDVGASSHWVAVPRDATEDPVREFGPMTDCYDPPYSSLFVPSYSGVRQEESPTL